MKSISRLVFFLLVQLSYQQCFAQKIIRPATGKFTPAQLKEDYRVLIKTLREAYPSTYRYNTKTSLNTFFKNGVDKLGTSMTEKEFYPIVALTAAKMKDEHIIPTPSDAYYKEVYKKTNRFLPFSIKLINKHVYVCKSAEPQLRTGDEVISINGTAARRIIERLARYVHRDGYIKTFVYRHLED